MRTVFDLHCHILCGVDDGADDISDSLDMLRLAAESGTRGIVATPHDFTSDGRRQPIPLLQEKVAELNRIAAQEQIPIRIDLGEELLYCPDTVALLQEGKLLTVAGTRYVLTEFSDDTSFEESLYAVKALKKAGYRPIVAHPERYRYALQYGNVYECYKQLGALLQVNKDSITGRFGDVVRRRAFYILQHGLADIVASDAHSPFSRTPYLGDVHEMISESFSYALAERLLSQTPKRILEDYPA